MTGSPFHEAREPMPSTITDVLQGIEPMGDLSRFEIDDLTPEEEDVFFGILEDI